MNSSADLATYRVQRNNEIGRYGVATRTLEPGELILTELPLVIGPKASTSPVCLGCYNLVDCTVLCSTCAWPVCTAECEMATCHAQGECQIFSDAHVTFQPFDDWSSSCPQYECITPLRLLLTKQKYPERWDTEIKFMEDHNNERRGTSLWSANQVNTVDFIRKACKLADKFNDEEIHSACGLLDVNSFEVRAPCGTLIRGLYPLTAIFSHCCVANSTHSITPVNELGEEYRLRLRASVKVDKDQELYTSYSHSLEPTLTRREKLRESKFFECRCLRCSDPTELGSHLGSLKCSKCDNGIVLSIDPLDADAQWKCTHCEFVANGDQVRRAVSIIQREIDQLDYIEPGPEAIEMREQLFRKYRSVLHPQHSCMTALRHSLTQLYGRIDGYMLDDLPDLMLERKIQLCRDLLAVADVVEPGYTRLRALTLYELHAPILIFTKSRCRYGELKSKELQEKLEEAAGYLKEAVTILKLEDPSSPEGFLGIMGERSLIQLRDSIQSLNNTTAK